MSGRARCSHSHSWAARARMPFTFQVAIFMAEHYSGWRDEPCPGVRDREVKRGAPSDLALDDDRAAMRFDELLDDRESQAQSPLMQPVGLELLKNPLEPVRV